MKRFSFVLLVIIALLFSGKSNAALWDRGGGLIYDDVSNITWLQDVNYAKTSGYATDGRMTWDEAMAWADQLVYAGYDDWRLPTTIPATTGSGGNGDISSEDYINQTLSEMGHLFHVELGNTNFYTYNPLSPVNYGPFLNFGEIRHYWSSTEKDTDKAFAFDFSEQAYQDYHSKTGYFFGAWAVRDGDVASVPEPTTLLLLGFGLLGIVEAKRRLRE